ncbi:MAG TPA: hypothetical protein VH720_08080 [Candidatus Limnocylindrales bacterium]|jgi:hypothetical protein
MISRSYFARDPFEGTAAYRTRIRCEIQGAIALVLAIAACGLTAVMWIRALTPAFERILAS